MPMIQWSDRLAIGVAEIDDQHVQLVGIINDLHATMLVGKAESAAPVILARLIGYTREHFAFEERRMQSVHYPAYAAHKHEHEVLLAKIDGFQLRLVEHGHALSASLLLFLRDWLLEHIGQCDRKLGEFIGNLEAESALRHPHRARP